MKPQYLKKASKTAAQEAAQVADTVREILANIEQGGEAAARRYAEKFDKYSGDIVLSQAQIDAAADKVSPQLKKDIQFARDNVSAVAAMQKNSIKEDSMEVVPGLRVGQKAIPCNSVGCYAPGGRYSHIASAIMTVATAKAAGCKHVVLATPPQGEAGAPAAIVYTANLCGANSILALGGVQGVAAMAFGLFGMPKADVLAGPGNQFVAEAKRLLYGRVGIDMFAGPTDSLIIADHTADVDLVAADLAGQAEHGHNSPVWLVTTDRKVADYILEQTPKHIAALPEPNQSSAAAAWRDYAEVILCESREEAAATADKIAPEHLTVQAEDLDWWLSRLRCYGSLFLGEETTVAFGDKASGANHVLPTNGAARYTGGLSVHKFMKLVTWQRATRDGARPVAEATARISRLEGMEAHARTADMRLAKFFPQETFDLGELPPRA